LAILQRPYAGQVKNLTPPAAGCGGWFLAVGGVICCGRWAAGLAGCGVGRCWRLAAGCCEVWQGVQAVQLVGCGVIGAALAVPVLPGAGGWRNIRVPRPALPGYFPAFPRGGRRQHPARAGLLIRQAGQAGRRRKRKRPGQTARRALLLWPLVCTGGNGSGGVRPGAGGGADLLAVPVGMVSAGTVPAGGVPASRLALAVLHPGRFWPFAGGVRFSTLPGSALGVGL
jgi:hypothetical protein